jgi:hypothetical protein
MMMNAIATAMAWEPMVANDPSHPESRGSISRASAGSPIQPSASEEMVMPS